MRSKSITLIVKPTQECNLSCSYCYDSVAKKSIKNKIMPIEIIEKIAEFADNSFENISWIWHGGEPLLAGKEFFYSAHEKIKEKMTNAKVDFSMQSNGKLFKENEQMLRELGINISFSYDFTNGNKNRGFVDEANIKGSINVVGYDDSFKLIETYEKLVADKKICSFNVMFLNDYSKEQMVEIADNYCKLFEHILFDNRDGAFVEREIESVIDSVLGKLDVTCNYTNCIGDFLSINPDGDIFSCDRFNNFVSKEYMMLNIYDIEFTMLEYKNSKAFYKLKEDDKIFREKCKSCEVVSFCKGICKANRTDSDNKIDVKMHKENECEYRKRMFKYIFSRLFNLTKEEYKNLNDKIYGKLFDMKFTPKFLIEEVENETNN